MQTAERSSSHDPSEQVIYNRCLFAYQNAAGMVSGDIIELGSGEGYGIKWLANRANHYLAVDKFETHIEPGRSIEFRKLLLPSLDGVSDNTFDFAVSFQVIEHIKDDRKFLEEIHRVLKPGGRLLATTPNRMMSLSRNPWHIREYTASELTSLVGERFSQVAMKGIYGNAKVMEYHNRNKASVNRIMKYDILDLQYRLPGWVLRIPYDIMNRINRRKLHVANQQLVDRVGTEDFYVSDASDSCLDLFLIATK